MEGPSLLRPHELGAGTRYGSGRWPGEDIWQVLTAARAGDVATLRDALRRAPGLVSASYWYMPPLHFAVREGHLEAVRLLVAAGADLSHRNALYGNDTLLQMAEDRGHRQVAGFLREALHRRLASAGVRHAVHEAVAGGDTAGLTRLLAADSRLADRGDHLGRRPLHYAVAAGREDLVDLLLNAGAEIDAHGFGGDDRLGGGGFRPVVLALWRDPYWGRRDDLALARHLLERGAACSPAVAAALGDESRLEELLRADAATANMAEACGKRPLSAAAERGRLAIVRRLLVAGADPNLPEGPNCPRGFALWAAVHHGHQAIVELLLAAGADPNAEVESSGTPTTAAATAELRALLYRYGGRMGLAAHCYRGDVDTVAALLEARPGLFDTTALEQAFPHCVQAGHEGLLRNGRAPGLEVNTDPVWRVPLLTFMVYGAVGPLMGGAEAVCELVCGVLEGKTNAYSYAAMDKQMSTRVRMAQNQMTVEATRRLFDAGIQEVSDKVARGHEFSREERIKARMVACHVARTCHTVVNDMAREAGSRAIYNDSLIQRFQRDTNALATHALFDVDHVGDIYGGVLLGQEIPPSVML